MTLQLLVICLVVIADVIALIDRRSYITVQLFYLHFQIIQLASTCSSIMGFRFKLLNFESQALNYLLHFLSLRCYNLVAFQRELSRPIQVITFSAKYAQCLMQSRYNYFASICGGIPSRRVSCGRKQRAIIGWISGCSRVTWIPRMFGLAWFACWIEAHLIRDS